MKHILITGKDSYIGTSFERWMSQWPEKYQVNIVDTITDDWKKMDFSKFDVILHVAAIVHKKEKKEMLPLYMKINCELPLEIAQKARAEGVKQFIFMSTMSVYGMEEGIIDEKSMPQPKTLYGKSKFQAEKQLIELGTEKFKLVFVRPPMVYGKGSKGNYPRLAKIARKSYIFPDIDNEKSLIHIDNLCEFLRLMINDGKKGIYFPQNKDYVNTSEMVKKIADIHNRKIYLLSVFNPLIKILKKRVLLFNKVFGNLVYDKKISNYKNFEYCVWNFEKSISVTES
ncbi:UDP-glucose 4-epimerase [Eubacterium maltosivorans]|uniref:NAD-dependent epimerase/dehydratase family protein n=1 Tax=Eubacterium maltosivorans TaxID=2041044 RepID=UPI00087ECC5E|nr:NAD-dependent epimerase/dehydratase family protein [Eubacterium maltosivorans]WPK79436.1 N-acetyl-alpha-D-glucosaminyl-diphospho-ditrans,octacis-undecaprenol 4-epimerase [Eubacterium maltosivorans]SDP40891.1 UDP-glucose 4-epimerase [Eubacterium maltosivorans]